MKRDTVGGACSTYRRDKYIQNSNRKLGGKSQLEDIGVGGRIMETSFSKGSLHHRVF